MEINAPYIRIVGCGPGSLEHFTASAIDAVAQAGLLVGAERLLALFPDHPAKRISVGADIDSVLDEIGTYLGHLRIVVLVTGDPGLCSLAQPVIKHFGREACEVIPGISSIQVAFARMGLDWLNARVIDAHSGVPRIDPLSLAGEEKIAVLPGHSASKAWVIDLIRTVSHTHRVYICQDLTLENEHIRRIESHEKGTMDFSLRTILLCIKEGVL